LNWEWGGQGRLSEELREMEGETALARPYAAGCGGVHASEREATRRLAPAGGRPVMLLRIHSNF